MATYKNQGNSSDRNPGTANEAPLPQWGSGGASGAGGGGTPPSSRPAVVRKRKRWPKVLLGLLLLLLIVVGVAIALAPMIASSVAPAVIEKAADESITGSVKVKSLSLSWGGPTVVGPVELYDDKGVLVGQVQTQLNAGLWKIVSEQWWSKKQLDVGILELNGNLNVVREVDGSSNLERAVKPTKPSQPKPPSKGGDLPFDSLKATLKITGLDVTYTDKQAAAGTPMASGVGVTKFSGDVKVDYDAKGGNSTAKADLAGDIKGAASGDRITLALDANLKQNATGGLERIDARVDLLGAPLALVDGIVGFGGELVKSVGPRGDVRVQAAGNADKATATLAVVAEGASADLALDYADGVLRATKPGVLKLRSTTFVGELPTLREKMKQLADSVRLEAGPSVDVTITTLSIPVPKSALGLGGAGSTPAKIDLRPAAVDVGIAVGAQRGLINTGKLSGASPEQANRAFEPFTVEPLTVKLTAPRLDGAKRLTASSQATIGGKPAGQVAVDLTATGLFNKEGAFDLGALERAEGEARLTGVTTALLQPIIDAAGVKVDLAQDVGPTIDVVVRPTTTVAPAEGKLPPTDINLAITSANIRSTGDLRIDNNVITTLGAGMTVDVASARPLVARMMSPAADAPAEQAVVVAGRLPVHLTVRDLSVDTAKKPLGVNDITAWAEVRVSDASVALNLAKPSDANAAPTPVSPIILGQSVLSAALVPGQPPAIGVNAALNHENNPFTVKGNFTAAGLAANPAPATSTNQIDKLVAMKIAGRLDVIDIPRSLAKLVPAADAALNPTGVDGSAEIKRLVAALVGPNLDLAVTTEAVDGAQRAKIDLAGAGLTATTSANITSAAVDVAALSAQARLTPEQTAATLAAFTPRPEPVQGQPAPAFTPMSLASPVTLMVAAQPLRVPFKPGTTEPDLEKVGEATAQITTDKPVLVSNIPAGGKLEAAGLGTLVATAKLPVGTYLATANTSPVLLAARVTSEVLRPTTGGSAWAAAVNPAVCAKVELDASLPMRNPETAESRYAVKLIDVDAVALSPLTGDPLLLPGALGDRIQVAAVATMAAGAAAGGQRIGLQADIDAPRLKGASIRGSTQNDVFRVDAAKMTWTPSVAWFNSVVFAPKAGAPAGPTDQLAQETTFTLDVKSLVASLPKSEGDVPVQGPMKPGVFNADLSLTSPGAVIRRADGQVVRAEDIRVAVLGGQKPGSVSIDAAIARVSGEGNAAASKASILKVAVDNIADQRGVLTTDKAIINVTGDLDTFPTPLIDSLAGLNGKVVDLLGSTLNLKLTATNVSKTVDGGVISATAASPRAGAELKGVIRDQTFQQDGKFEIDVYEMLRYEIAKKLPGGMPLVGFIEKQKGVDEPAMIRAEGLRVPLDNNMRKLNGVITVDPGTASFEFNDAFSKILKQLSQKDRGQMGQRLDPFIVNIKDGVASYDKFKLKFGEFTLETTGAADLVQKRIDVVTYIPAGAMTEELLNAFKGTLGANAKGFTSQTRFPFTTKGPLDNPKTEPDFGLFLKENAGKLIEDVGGKALEDLFKKLKGDK